MDGQSPVVAIGDSALTGWRRPVGRALARPIADHSRFTREQIEAAIGIAILAWTIYRSARPIIGAVRRSSDHPST